MSSTARLSLLGTFALVTEAVAAPGLAVNDLPPIPTISEDLDTTVDVSLTSATDVDDDRVSGAAKREQSLGSVASAVTVVTPDQIRRFGYRTVAEALAGVAGVHITDDRAIERVGIRGVQLLGDANTRILILIDGTPLNEPWAQYVDASDGLPIDLEDVARIEVIRGPVSSIYGTNAFLGIVNIVTKAADVAAPVRGRVGVEASGGVNGSAGFASGDVDRQIRGGVAFRRRAGEELQYGAIAATSADRQDSVHAGLTATYDRLFVQARAAQRERQLPGAPFDSSVGSDDNTSRDRQLVAELGYTQEVANGVDLTGRVYGAAYDLRQQLSFDDASTLAAAGRSRWAGVELRLNGDLSSLTPDRRPLDLTIGAALDVAQTSAESRRSSDTMSRPTIEQNFSVQAVYGEAEAQPTSWAAISAGVRFDRNSLFESNLNPRLALLLYKEEVVGAKLLYAQGFRNPSAFEAFFEDSRFKPACSPMCATSGTTLFPETIASYEGVLWARPWRGLKLRVSTWQWDLRSLVERRAIFDPATFEERFQYQNLAELRSRGFEVEATYRDTSGWFAFAGGAFAEVRRNVIATPPNAPELTAVGGISTPPLFGEVHLSGQVQYVGSRVTRDDQVLAGDWIGVDVTLFLPSIADLEVTLAGRNLVGERLEVVAQDDYDRQGDVTQGVPPVEVLLVPGAGRELFLRLGYRR